MIRRRHARLTALFVGLYACASVPARADDCRSAEITFKPTRGLQIAIWVESPSGDYLATAYVTRATGVFGIGNRPGNALFKSDVRWPYGRREMVLPVWAHKRNHPYGRVVMGGKHGNSEQSCAATTAAYNCDDDTIGYHATVSSSDPYFCSPSGGIVTTTPQGVDAVSCASPFFGSKGAYAPAPALSLYPPRADLTSFIANNDSVDAMGYAAVNDLVAISGATPQADVVLATPVLWQAPAEGDYVIKVEVSLENDLNAFHSHVVFDDVNPELRPFGDIDRFGQPSIVYAVPVTLSSARTVALSSTYQGYGDWDGASGTLHLPDMTISDAPGTGAGRLLDVTDADGSYRVKVVGGTNCSPSTPVQPTDGGTTDGGATPGCAAPGAPTDLSLTPSATAIDVSLRTAATGAATARLELRYRESDQPITDADFLTALPASELPPVPSSLGAEVTTAVSGLRPTYPYAIAVRAVSACGAASAVVSATTSTKVQHFAVLHGCFLASAAFGAASLHPALATLRALRDRWLLGSTAGQLAVATYYAFSPPLARVVAGNGLARSAVRATLAAMVSR